MIRDASLYTLATSGLNASAKLLATTSNNIANVNSEGYVRERTEFTSRLNGGVDFGFTDRVLDVFAQNQLRRDTSQVGETQAFFDRAESLDNVLASEANSISASITRFFDAIQTATDDPTNMPSRDSVIGEAQGMLNRINQLGDFFKIKETEVEQQIEASVSVANGLIRQIGDLNEAIQVAQGNSNVDTPTALLNQRDEAILGLAELVAIDVRRSSNRDEGVVVNLRTGESLVLADGNFNIFSIGGEPDYTNRQLELSTDFAQFSKNDTKINVLEQNLGGALGGIFTYREQVLEPAERNLGKMAAVMASVINRQNREGMDLDQQLGRDIFSIENFRGLNYPDNSDLALDIEGRFAQWNSQEITNNDYKITVLTVPAGVPATFDIQVEALTSDGRPEIDENGNPITQTTTVTAAPGAFNDIIGGIQVELASGNSYAVGDAFLLQPARFAASSISLATSRGEDLAFAKPLRVDASIGNLGTGVLSQTRISNSNVDLTFTSQFASAFDGNGGIQDVTTSPSPIFGAPVGIRFTAGNEYEVLDSNDNVISTVSGTTNLNNLIAQAKSSGVPAWPAEFAALSDYPGYDFNLQGNPKAGDEFFISYNTNGVNDNRNALELAELQQNGFVRQSNSTIGNLVSFNEAYATIVGQVGSATSSSKIDLEAAKVMQVQSSEWFESSSGVSLDEEAANLIQFQQSYAAAARILSSAQEMFQTILQVAR